jgi:hypothetical protein
VKASEAVIDGTLDVAKKAAEVTTDAAKATVHAAEDAAKAVGKAI